MSEELKNLPPETLQALDITVRTLQPAQTIEEVKDRLVQSDKGKILQKFENYVTALTCDPCLHGAIRLNMMTERVEIVKDVWWKRRSPELTDTDLRYLRLYLEQNYDLGNPKNITEAVELIASEWQYHPVCELLESLQWDGTERIRYALHRFLGAPDDDFSYEVLKLFMMGSIARIYHPGCKFDYMLCLIGGQGAGKSSFFRLLAIRDEWFSDDLKKLDDDNVYRKMSGHWIIEMSEMLGIGTAKSTDEIKSFLSRQKETYKDPYDKYARDRLRQCVFGGTTNRMDFLPLDRTGNRRFLPVLVDMDKAEVHLLENEKKSRAYMLQMWAEAMVLYRNKDYELKFPERLEAQLLAIQKECMPDDSLAGIIQVFLDQYKGNAVCTLQLYREALKHPLDRPTNRESRELNDIMNNSVIGWKKCAKQRRIAGYGQQRAWERDRHEQIGTACVNKDEADGVNDINEPTGLPDGFNPVPEQMKLPF